MCCKSELIQKIFLNKTGHFLIFNFSIGDLWLFVFTKYFWSKRSILLAYMQEEYNAAATPGDAADASDIHEGIGKHVERHVDPAERDWHIKVRERMR